MLFSDSDFELVQHEKSNISGSIDGLSTKAPVFLFQPRINDTGFLVSRDGQQLIWIPPHLRGNQISVYLSTGTVVIGGSNGNVTFIHFL